MESLTLRTIFLKYPNKKETNTSTLYIPKSQRTNNELSVDYVTFRKIVELYFKKCINTLFSKGEVKLYDIFGILELIKFKTDKTLDFPKANVTGKRTNFKNYHSFGYVVKVHWNKNMIFPNRKLYKFVLNKQLKKELAQRIKSDPTFVLKLQTK